MRPVFLFLKCWEIGFTFVSSAHVFVSGLSLRTSPHVAHASLHTRHPTSAVFQLCRKGMKGGRTPLSRVTHPLPDLALPIACYGRGRAA